MLSQGTDRALGTGLATKPLKHNPPCFMPKIPLLCPSIFTPVFQNQSPQKQCQVLLRPWSFPFKTRTPWKLNSPSDPDDKRQLGFCRYVEVASFSRHPRHPNLGPIHLSVLLVVMLGFLIDKLPPCLSKLKTNTSYSSDFEVPNTISRTSLTILPTATLVLLEKRSLENVFLATACVSVSKGRHCLHWRANDHAPWASGIFNRLVLKYLYYQNFLPIMYLNLKTKKTWFYPRKLIAFENGASQYGTFSVKSFFPRGQFQRTVVCVNTLSHRCSA